MSLSAQNINELTNKVPTPFAVAVRAAAVRRLQDQTSQTSDLTDMVKELHDLFMGWKTHSPIANDPAPRFLRELPETDRLRVFSQILHGLKTY